MEAAAELLAELGVEPIMTRATAARLHSVEAGASSIPSLPG
jgi:hypothetical protein